MLRCSLGLQANDLSARTIRPRVQGYKCTPVEFTGQQFTPSPANSLTETLLLMSSGQSERYASEVVDQKILGDALELPTSKLVAKSRFLKAAMTERLASWDQHDVTKRGLPDDRLVRLYEAWGKGGFGIILSMLNFRRDFVRN